MPGPPGSPGQDVAAVPGPQGPQGPTGPSVRNYSWNYTELCLINFIETCRELMVAMVNPEMMVKEVTLEMMVPKVPLALLDNLEHLLTCRL